MPCPASENAVFDFRKRRIHASCGLISFARDGNPAFVPDAFGEAPLASRNFWAEAFAAPNAK